MKLALHCNDCLIFKQQQNYLLMKTFMLQYTSSMSVQH